jgi:hypothetical protein
VKSIYTGELPAAQWSMTLGAFGLLGAGSNGAGSNGAGAGPISAAAVSPLGIAMSGGKGAAMSHGSCTAAIRRIRPDAVLTAPVALPAPANSKQETYNQYATSVDVDGVGTSGPPRERETA